MALKALKLTPQKLHIHIEMKPMDITDKYLKIPTEQDVLDALANSILFGLLDTQFNIRIVEA